MNHTFRPISLRASFWRDFATNWQQPESEISIFTKHSAQPGYYQPTNRSGSVEPHSMLHGGMVESR